MLVALAAAWYVRDSQRTLSTVIASNVASVQAAQELEISFREIHVQFDRYLITLDRKYLESVPVLKRRTEEALHHATAAAGSPQEQALMKRVSAGYEHFFREYDRLKDDPPPQGVYSKVLELIDTVLTREILEPTREYLILNERPLTSRPRRTNSSRTD